MEQAKHPAKEWLITITEFKEQDKKKYKVTRRMPHMSIAETRVFDSKEKATKQFNEWLK